MISPACRPQHLNCLSPPPLTNSYLFFSFYIQSSIREIFCDFTTNYVSSSLFIFLHYLPLYNFYTCSYVILIIGLLLLFHDRHMRDPYQKLWLLGSTGFDIVNYKIFRCLLSLFTTKSLLAS